MDKKLKINTWTAIFNIINCIAIMAVWSLVIFTFFIVKDIISIDRVFYIVLHYKNLEVMYVISWIGIVLNAICAFLSYKHGAKLTGPILGILGSICFILTETEVTTLPTLLSIILLITSCVFLFRQRPGKKVNATQK